MNEDSKKSNARAFMIRVLTSEWTAIAIVSLALWISLCDGRRDTLMYTPKSSGSHSKSYNSAKPTDSPSAGKTNQPKHHPSYLEDLTEAPKASPKDYPSSHRKTHPSRTNTHIRSVLLYPLRPEDLPDPVLFKEWQGTKNETLYDLPGRPDGQTVARGAIQQTTSSVTSKFSILPAVIPPDKVSQILKIIHGSSTSLSWDPEHGPETAVPLDTEPDSVDGMTSQDIFLDNDSLRG